MTLWYNRLMQEISTKQLQNHIASYLANLPLTLTRRGKPVAVVIGWTSWKKLARHAEESRELTKGLSEGRCTECARRAESLTKVTYLGKYRKLCRFCFEALKAKIAKEGGEVTLE